MIQGLKFHSCQMIYLGNNGRCGALLNLDPIMVL